MPRLFISHAGENTAEAVAICDWLAGGGWDDVFLDTDPERGIKAGENWKKALKDAGNRCEAVLFLVSPFWLRSDVCRAEFNLADYASKRLFGVVLEGTVIDDLPGWLTADPQFVSVAKAGETRTFSVVLPRTGEAVKVEFSSEGLRRLKIGLQAASLDAKYFAWPPENDPDRPPYRGLKPLEAEDAGIFFGREGPVAEALDRLHALRDTAPPRLLVILGASGAGKSSFLRAGLFPRLARDDRNFLPLPVIRPERSAISGEIGLLPALERGFTLAKIAIPRADLRLAIQGGAAKLKPLLQALADKATPMAVDGGVKPNPPALILSIDQAEELFLAEAQDEAQPFLSLVRDLLNEDAPPIIPVFTIRSDNYERLQLAKLLEGVRQETFSLPPMPMGSYADVVKGPARRLAGTARALDIEDALVGALLADIEAGGAKDALPLLAFTLERLYSEFHGGGALKLSQYDALGRVKGSIEAAVERALRAADADSAVPRDRVARMVLLRRGLIPWLAGIDPDTGAPRRRIARLSEIPTDARPLIEHLVEQRLLVTDVAKDTGETTIEATHEAQLHGVITIEAAHEALLRQWGQLQAWLTEDAALLAVLEGVKRASRDWAANNHDRAWLTHSTDRLASAERLTARPDLAANLEPTDREYLAACRAAEADEKWWERLVQAAIYVMLFGIIAGLVGWINQSYIKDQWRWYIITGPFTRAKVKPYVLSAAKEKALKPTDSFRECATDEGTDYCPEMVVVPAGLFLMGSPTTEKDRYPDEGPQHNVTIVNSFAVSKFELTFDEWDTCVAYGSCAQDITDAGWGRGKRPVINVTWDHAQQYVAWLSKVTGMPYRLLTEAEYEYAARAGTQTAYPWGDDIGKGNANCDGCGSQWDSKQQTAPVGSFAANKFGLYDMVGNVWEWVQDCYHSNYEVESPQGKIDPPTEGSEWTAACPDDRHRVVRGGSWSTNPETLRSANRDGATSDDRNHGLGFRVARTFAQ